MIFLLEYFDNPNRNYVIFKECLEKNTIKYLLIDLKDRVKILDKELLIEHENSQSILADLKNRKDIYIYGGKKLSEFTIKENLRKGSFDNPKLEYKYLVDNLKSHLVSKNVVIGKLKEIQNKFKEGDMFLRPNKCNKLINGGVYSSEEFKGILAKYGNSKDEFVLATPVSILEEYRFFILDNEVVTSSSYNPNLETKVPSEATTYVKSIIADYDFGGNFVIDIAKLEYNTFKIVELNNISTSGLYNANVQKLIESYVKLENKKD